jgi:hypothetical protein
MCLLVQLRVVIRPCASPNEAKSVGQARRTLEALKPRLVEKDTFPEKAVSCMLAVVAIAFW